MEEELGEDGDGDNNNADDDDDAPNPIPPFFIVVVPSFVRFFLWLDSTSRTVSLQVVFRFATWPALDAFDGANDNDEAATDEAATDDDAADAAYDAFPVVDLSRKLEDRGLIGGGVDDDAVPLTADDAAPFGNDEEVTLD